MANQNNRREQIYDSAFTAYIAVNFHRRFNDQVNLIEEAKQCGREAVAAFDERPAHFYSSKNSRRGGLM